MQRHGNIDDNGSAVTTRRTQWLVGMLAASVAIALYSVCLVHLGKRSDCHATDDRNWEEHWNQYYRTVGLAVDALEARRDGRTNDFEVVLASEFFDEWLKKTIRRHDKNGDPAAADRMLKTYIDGCVVQEMGNPRPSDSVITNPTLIVLFRRIAALQPTVAHIALDSETEDSVARFIEESLRAYEAFANPPGTNALTVGETQ